MELIGALAQTNEEESDSNALRQQKRDAWGQLVSGAAWAHLCTLMHSYDPNILRAGDSALHLVAAASVPVDENDWPYKLAQQLIARGADVNAPNAHALTPLLIWAKASYDEWPCGVQLLLQHGADINMRDSAGDSALHWLVHLHNGATLQLLGERGWLAGADLFVANNNGETPLQLAQRVAAMKSPKAGAAEVRDSLAAPGQHVAARRAARDTGAAGRARTRTRPGQCGAGIRRRWRTGR